MSGGHSILYLVSIVCQYFMEYSVPVGQSIVLTYKYIYINIMLLKQLKNLKINSDKK